MTTEGKKQLTKLLGLMADYNARSVFDWRIQSLVRDIRKHNAENDKQFSQADAVAITEALIGYYWEHLDTKPE